MDNSDPIIDLLQSFAIRPGPYRVCDFLDALTVFPGDHIASLTKALADQDDEVRLFAAEVLGEMGDKAESALPNLIESLEDPDRLVRIAAVYAVVNFGSRATDAIPVLESWLYCGDEFSEVAAAAAIIQVDASYVDGVLPVLTSALEGSDYGIQCHAAWNIGQLGSVAKESLRSYVRRVTVDELGGVRARTRLEQIDENLYHLRLTFDLQAEVAQDDWRVTITPAFEPSFHWSPHLTPTDRHIVDQHAFRSPALIANTVDKGLTVIPDLEIMARGTPVRWYMDMDAYQNTLVLGMSDYGFTMENYAYRPGGPWDGIICYPRTGDIGAFEFGDLIRVRHVTQADSSDFRHFRQTYMFADFADLNRDKLPDVVYCPSRSDTLYFFLNSGERDAGGMPIFVASGSTPRQIHAWQPCRAVDLNGDGSIDFVVGGFYLENTNPQGWPIKLAKGVSLDAGKDACFYDVDDDKRLDSVCLMDVPGEGLSNHRVAWRRNLGGEKPTFGPPEPLSGIDAPYPREVNAVNDGPRRGVMVNYRHYEQVSFFEQTNQPG